ncbi:MAG: glycosyltransferase family 2 protein [Nanoarchaeota archaeon]
MKKTTPPETKVKPKLSIVIPAYNENKNIPLILQGYAEVISNLNAELIIVNNGSTDNSQQILEEELKKPRYIFAKTILIPRNAGYGNGIVAGLKHCRGEILAYSHADMQCDPLDVIRGYEIISKEEKPENCFVKGKRRERKIIPQLLTTCFQIITSVLFFKNFYEINAQPKVFPRRFLEKLNYIPLDFNLDFYFFYKAKKEKFKVIHMPVDYVDRRYGESKWAFSHLSKLKTVGKFIRYILALRFFGEEKAFKIIFQKNNI